MEQRIEVGLIVKPQGIRGEVKVKPYTDDPSPFYEFKRVFLEDEEYRVLNVRSGAGMVYLGLRGVADRNAAELLRNKRVFVPRDEMPEPEEGRYYVCDLLGAVVISDEGEEPGVLTDVRTAATDIYTVEKDGREIVFPTAAGVVLRVDVEGKKIVVNAKRFYEVALL